MGFTCGRPAESARWRSQGNAYYGHGPGRVIARSDGAATMGTDRHFGREGLARPVPGDGRLTGNRALYRPRVALQSDIEPATLGVSRSSLWAAAALRLHSVNRAGHHRCRCYILDAVSLVWGHR